MPDPVPSPRPTPRDRSPEGITGFAAWHDRRTSRTKPRSWKILCRKTTGPG